jgi:branched-subunit amino acid transport protein
MDDIWLVIAAAAAVTFAWRLLGVAVSGRLRPDSPVIRWVACVAYAMVAGYFVRAIVLPGGPLAATPPFDRLAAAALGFAVFLVARRSVFGGTASAVALLIGLTMLGGAL